MTDYLSYLMHHPSYGALFPNRLAVAVFGVPNRHHIDKHRPFLQEGIDWVTLPSASDHTPRVYYTLSGLPKLCDLVGTPQAQSFKHTLLQAIQSSTPTLSVPPGGALVPTPLPPTVPPPSAPLVPIAATSPLENPNYPHPYPPTPQPLNSLTPQPFNPPTPTQPIPSRNPDPLTQVTHHLSHAVASQFNHTLAQHMAPIAQSMAQQPRQPTLQELSAFYQEAQSQAVAHVKTGLEAAQQVQTHTADNLGHSTTVLTETHTHSTPHAESGFNGQDRLAFWLLCSLVCAFISLMTLGLAALLQSSRRYAPQSYAPSHQLITLQEDDHV